MSQRAISGLQAAAGYPVTEIPLAGARPYERETLNWAQEFFPDCGFDRVVGTDFTPIWEAALIGGANVPTIDNTFTGGVMQFSAGGASAVALNPVTPGAGTYNAIMGGTQNAGQTFSSRARPFVARAKIMINAIGITAGKEAVLLSVDGGYVGGRGIATSSLQLVIAGTTSPTQCYIRLAGGFYTAGPVQFSCGPDGNLGGYNSLLPVNQFINVAIAFDLKTIYYAFSDVYRSTNSLSGLVHDQDAMPYDAGGVSVNNSPGGINDTTLGTNFKIDALAYCYASEQGNK